MSGAILMDFDDTLVETTVYFEMAREKYSRYMADLGFPLEEVLEVLDRADIENVNKYGGFLKECFPHAMAQTYHHFCNIKKIKSRDDIRLKVEAMGWWVFDQPPVLIPGVGEVLEELSACYPLYLTTKGDPSLQLERVSRSGLSSFFKKIYVLKDKTHREYSEIAGAHGLIPGSSWVVGNSIKSDINPGLKAGFNCIYIPNRYTWHHEMEEPLGGHHTLGAITEVPPLVKSPGIGPAGPGGG